MKKIKGRIISLLTVTALIATGTAPQAFAEARKESSTSEAITDYTVPEQNTEEEQAYITGEAEDLRTRYSKTYEQSDGSMISVISAAPIHFYDDEKEAWEEYDNRLTYNEETENYESDENGSDMQVSLPQNIDEQNDIEVEADGYKVSITTIDMNSSSSKKTNEKKNVKGSSEKSLKKYNLEDYVSDAVLDGKVEYMQDKSAKVEYIFSGSGLKENIILSEAPEENKTYSFRIKVDGLTAKLKKDNSVVLRDGENKIFTIPAPYMYDSEFEFSSEIKTTLKKDGTEYILTYAPDYEWLTDKDRAYPITIDPTVSTKNYNDKVVDTSVISAAPLDLASNPNLYAGALGNRNCVVDAYIKFLRLPSINKQWTISNAKLNLKTASDKDNKINAYKITSDWETSTVKAYPPTVESTIVDVCSVPSKTDTWVYWDITNTVFDWYNGGANYGIKLSSPYATNNQSVFYSADAADSESVPYISIEYTTISSAQLENSRTIDIGRAGTATINDFTGNLVLSREEIGVDGNRMPVNISMIYNLNDTINPTFGYGFKTNYSQKISYTGDAGKNKYYEYVCGDGSIVYFDEDAETGAYIDRSGRGYTFINEGTSANDYSNIIITDSSGNEYHFDRYGRLIKISSNKGTEESAIEVAYVGDYTKYYEIDYIKDGAGRKYDFNYTNGKLSDISYYGNTNTVLKKVTYQYDSSSKLTKVTYPDGKSVKYTYGNQCLVAAYNTDNYHVTFNYTHYTSSSKANRVTKIIEYGSLGTKGGDISVEYTPFQTKYINNNTDDTETLVFNKYGDLISTYDSQGAVTVNEYANSSEIHGINGLTNTYEYKKGEVNLITNGEFENDLTNWYVSNEKPSSENQGHPGNDKSVKLSGTPSKDCSIYQGVREIGKKGDTYDIGGWAKANASPQNSFQIKITFHKATRIVGAHTIDFNPYCVEWQYVMKSVQADGDYTHFFIELNYSNQINEAYFDGIVVYKGEKSVENDVVANDSGTKADSEGTNQPITSIGSDGSVTTTVEKDGVKTVDAVDKYGNDLSKETIINGVSLKENNEYSSSGNYLKSSSDSWGTKTSYDYDENTGNLNSVNVHYNPVYYTYDKAGNITKVSQDVDKLSNATAIENSYFYGSGDRISKITHNGFSYAFGYSEFGLLESIKAGNHNLINYSYDNDGFLTSESYGNGQTIDYKYNDDKNKATIKQNDKTLYAYNYDEFGNLISIKDNMSYRVTSYTTDTYGKSVIEETGDGVYHKLYSSKNENVEIIGDDTKSTKTFSDDYYNKSYWTVNGDVYSTYLNNIDKFDRTSSESIYRISHDSDDKEVASSKKVLYNKEYSYRLPDSNKTSDRVSKLTFTGGYNKTLNYGYDAYGNISEINNIWYLYDEASQLTTEVNIKTGTGKDFVYDKGGNITEVRHFTNDEYGETDTFTYGDSNWKDLLTAYNGNEITYDEIGNPLTYYNGTEFSWTMGRKLKSAVRSDGVKISYTYNADGLRTSKTIRNVKFNYFWNGDKLTGQTFADNTMYFRYDGDNPIGFEYNGEEYYYITNLQGDIIAILDSSGNLVAEYEYDAWGNCKIIKDTNTIAYINPLRYRGYYYDSDTDIYYLQSRYYDANIGRFINADDVEMLFEDQGTLVQYNLFVYCGNCVIINLDPNMIKNKKQAEAIINANVKNVVNYGAGSRKYDESKFKIKNKKKYEEHLQNAYNHLKVRIMYLYGYQNIGVLEGKKWNQLSSDVKSTIKKYKNEWNKTFVTKVVVKASFKNIKSAFGIMCKAI